jgi:putative transposase
MDKYLNKYRIPSARLQNWDYGTNGAYFITICTQNRVHYFGNIVQAQLIPSEMGEIAEKNWFMIPQYFPYVELGNFVVMPNHVHGILIINKPAETRFIASQQNHPIAPQQTPTTSSENTPLEARSIAPLQIPSTTPEKKPGGCTGNHNPMLHDNISRIIRWYKGRCAFDIRKIHTSFKWQSRFHDHIIRDTIAFENIQNYIANNPLNWEKDKHMTRQ